MGLLILYGSHFSRLNETNVPDGPTSLTRIRKSTSGESTSPQSQREDVLGGLHFKAMEGFVGTTVASRSFTGPGIHFGGRCGCVVGKVDGDGGGVSSFEKSEPIQSQGVRERVVMRQRQSLELSVASTTGSYCDGGDGGGGLSLGNTQWL